jgi:hypothetical protein
MKTQCSLKSAIFDICENHTWNNTPKQLTRLYSITIHAIALFPAGSDSANSKILTYNRRVQASSKCHLAVSLETIRHTAHISIISSRNLINTSKNCSEGLKSTIHIHHPTNPSKYICQILTQNPKKGSIHHLLITIIIQ